MQHVFISTLLSAELMRADRDNHIGCLFLVLRGRAERILNHGRYSCVPQGKSSFYRRSGCVLWPCFSWCRPLSVDRRKVTLGRQRTGCEVRCTVQLCRRMRTKTSAESDGSRGARTEPNPPKAIAPQVKVRLFTGMATGERPNTSACLQCTGSVLCRCPVMVIRFN